ncbi:MAG: toxin [Candidatus Omnitrophica bacterium]|nr:toxin [Candidatus Omnitrophota bacterium]
MKELRWDEAKNIKLRDERGASFEEVSSARFIGIEEHAKRTDQIVLLFEYNNYIWVIPCVEEKERYFAKTMFPSRKYTRKYL